MKFDGIIFDLDGTLWDSCRAVAESWGNTLSTRYDVPWRPTAGDIAGVMGLTTKEIAQRLFSRFGPAGPEMCRVCLAEEAEYTAVHGGDIYPGVEEMLAELSEKARLYIVSNCQEGYIESFLTYSGLGRLFSGFECEGHTGLRKTENIRLVVRREGLETPVYFGDTALDEKSAREAGCVFVHAAYGFGTAVAPDAAAASPGELPAILERLSRGE